VKDENGSLAGVSVVILEVIDSTMVSFGITNEKGKFELYDIPTGEFLLQTSFVGYSTYFQTIKVEKGLIVPVIIMTESSEILKEVSISAERIPMGILGDTINYNAAAFKTKEGATVEDLLKKMPGIDVNRDGSIKAFGEDVNNVLVDGKEFFNGDPTMATKNLEAEAVDKVQLFDKTSEEADFTGVDDGVKEKTINLSLKEDYKNGGFGRISAEGGTKDRYKIKANYNRFSPSLQASILGNSNNINENAFSFHDYLDFLGGLSNLLSSGGLNTDGLFGQENQQGINHQQATGVNFNYFKNKNWNLTSNYMYIRNRNSVFGNSISQQFNNVAIFETRDSIRELNALQHHKLRLKSKHTINPLNKLTFTIDGSLRLNEENSDNQYRYFLDELETQAINNQLNQIGRLWSFNSRMNYIKKFTKKGRNASIDLQYNNGVSTEDVNFSNRIRAQLMELNSDQFQSFISNEQTLSGSVNHTEPIGKKMYIKASLSSSNNIQLPMRSFYDIVDDEQILNTDLSSTFKRTWNRNAAALEWKRNRKLWKLQAQVTALFTQLQAFDLNDIEPILKEKPYVLSSVSIKRQFTNTTKVETQYNTAVTPPNLNQLMTIPNNLNPNNQIVGNKNLEPEYVHHGRLNFNYYDQFSFTSLFTNLQYQYSENKIVYQRSINPDFTTVSQAYQSPKFQLISAYANHSSPIRKLKIKYSITTEAMFQQYDTKLNELDNTVGSTSVNNTVQIENRKKEKWDVALGVRSSFSRYTNSLTESLVENFFEHRFFMDGLYHISDTWNVSLQYDLNRIIGRTISTDQKAINLHLINVEMTKHFLKNKWTATIRVNDLLNQNQGIFRSGSANGLYYSNFNALGRYFSAGISYKIGKKKEGSNELIIE